MRIGLGLAAALLITCAAAADDRPSILLVTLDTTRADAIGPEARGIDTPAFNALAANGRRFRSAHATVPLTLPSHASIMTGLYAPGHGVHQNGSKVSGSHPLVAERLRTAGYRTGAFVSSFVLNRKCGLDRGFETYDDEFPPKQLERSSRVTTDRAVAWLRARRDAPLFLWVHYYDPHWPYEPPEPYRSRYASNPYLAEIAAMDAQLGRLVSAFETATSARMVIVVSDHGEGMGEHGEKRHGNLVYQSTMHVPLVVAGAGIRAGVDDTPVSIRHIAHTILDRAGLTAVGSLRQPPREVVLGEAMTPFLEYGWQPQVMAIDGTMKTILAGRVERYDLAADPSEKRDVSAKTDASRAVRRAIQTYPVPSFDRMQPSALTDEDRRNLASLGYLASTGRRHVDRNAPRPADMTHLFERLERASIERLLAGAKSAGGRSKRGR